MAIWWLSFVDTESKRPRNLGVCIVEADSMIGAVIAARDHGCNPGGEVQGAVIPRDLYEDELHSPPMYKLMQRPELIERDLIKTTQDCERGN